jgi:phage baseplate assembly protein W
MNSFLGRGWDFPPSFGEGGRSVAMLEDEADILSSLRVLLSTRPGERVMRPDFGCNLDDLLFESLDTTLKTLMADRITTAILYHEPRIEVLRVDLDASRELDGIIEIEVEFLVRATNSRLNLVFPFYRTEGGTP